jgi:hypothetical protein
VNTVTRINAEENIPHLNSETGRAIVRMLHALGFPDHCIGFLFDADHDHISQMIDLMVGTRRINPEESIPNLNSETGLAIVRMLHALGFADHCIGFLFGADHDHVSQAIGLMNATSTNPEEDIPNLNSERGRAIVGLLYAYGFPEHRIGFLFDADHDHVSQVLNSDAVGFPEAPLNLEGFVSTLG